MFHRVDKRDLFLRAFQFEILSVCFFIFFDRLLPVVQEISPFRSIRASLLCQDLGVICVMILAVLFYLETG